MTMSDCWKREKLRRRDKLGTKALHMYIQSHSRVGFFAGLRFHDSRTKPAPIREMTSQREIDEFLGDRQASLQPMGVFLDLVCYMSDPRL